MSDCELLSILISVSQNLISLVVLIAIISSVVVVVFGNLLQLYGLFEYCCC